MLDLPLLAGPVPTLLSVVAMAALAWLLVRPVPARRVSVTGCLVIAAASTAVAGRLVTDVWELFPAEDLEPETYFWSGFAVFAIVLATTRIPVRPRGRTLTVLAATIVVAASANQINTEFQAYPTLRAAIRSPHPSEIAFDRITSAASLPRTEGPVETRWQPPPDLPAAGRITHARIPGTRSGFRARTAEIYLPPAYFTDPRPLLPVLVLLPGQPGSPQDWLVSGSLVSTMDTFAARHRGLAPIVVVADGTGGLWNNPLCADTRRARAATYLGVDVPDWIRANLAVDPDPAAWAVAGASYGATCAIQLALTAPETYPTFLSMSGESRPSLGSPTRTLEEGFDGDTAAFARADPLALLRTRPYPRTAGVVAVGDQDTDTIPESRTIATALTAAGAQIRYRQPPGGHDWRVWSNTLRLELPWLARRTGLTS
ncbi:alpha/beta hydrolase [Nocardia takedensis]|uniref:alpha/beta hydrolase n=1 Tax=Nocardia takedensis TaxID=259390 RepID=UPI0005945192|nr:alpha/beta hydrolase-fold protein [Nocardia takedensis]